MEESQSQLISQLSPLPDEFKGDILLERVSAARAIRSFIVKRLFGWYQTHGINTADRPWYRVTLNRHLQGHLFTCVIEVKAKGSTWQSNFTEPDLHQAVMSALNHMIPTTPAELTLEDSRIERRLHEAV